MALKNLQSISASYKLDTCEYDVRHDIEKESTERQKMEKRKRDMCKLFNLTKHMGDLILPNEVT